MGDEKSRLQQKGNSPKFECSIPCRALGTHPMSWLWSRNRNSKLESLPSSGGIVAAQLVVV